MRRIVLLDDQSVLMKAYHTIALSLLAGFCGAAAFFSFLESPQATPVPTIKLPTLPDVTAPRKTTAADLKIANQTPPSFELAATRSVDAVVHVRTASTIPMRMNPWHEMLGFEMPDQIQEGSGSGVIVRPNGIIVTNHHVIEGAEDIVISMNNNRTYAADVVGIDPSTDLAVLKISASEPLPYLEFGNSNELGIGEWVLAVGNPFDLTSTVTAGIVSAKARNINLLRARPERGVFPIESFIQTDAAVNPGNSGGALVNAQGQLVGINTAIASMTGSYAGYSFAVPASIVEKVTDDLVLYGIVQRAYLGIQIVPVNQQIADDMAMPEVKGCAITGFVPGSGSIESELQVGDVVLAINGAKISNFPELQECVSRYTPGDYVKVQVWRNGGTMECVVQLKDRDGQIASHETPKKPDVVRS